MEIVSRIGKIETNSERVFSLVSNFNNLSDFSVPNEVEDFTHDNDSCSFTVKKIGKVSMHIVEREPYKLVKIQSGDGIPVNFNLWIQLKELNSTDTRVKITLRAKVSVMLKPMLKKPLNQFVETLVTRLETIR